MRVRIIFIGEGFDKKDIQTFLQGVRDLEQQHFKDKLVLIMADTEELLTAEMNEVLNSIKPPFPERGTINGTGFLYKEA